MYNGELGEHSEDYQNGHSSGSVRAYDDAIGQWHLKAKEEPKKTYSANEVADILETMKDKWINHCETFGMGE